VECAQYSKAQVDDAVVRIVGCMYACSYKGGTVGRSESTTKVVGEASTYEAGATVCSAVPFVTAT